MMATAKKHPPYDPEIGEEICLAVMDGKHPQDVCGKNSIPEWNVVKRWLLKESDTFGERLKLAQRIGNQCEIARTKQWLDELMANRCLPWVKNEKGEKGGVLGHSYHEAAMRNLNQTLRHLCSIESKSVKHEVSGKGGGPISIDMRPPMSREDWIATYVGTAAGTAISSS